MNPLSRTAALLVVLLSPLAVNAQATVEEDDSALGEHDDSALGDDDDSAPGDDDDSALGDDDDSALGDDDDDDSSVEVDRSEALPADETVIRATLPWRVVPRRSLEPADHEGPGWHSLSRRDLEQGAGPLSDPMHALHLLPGVNSDQAANAWFTVRGGGRDELAVELDGIRIRELTHLTGIMSVIDSALVENVELVATGPPAHLPEALSGALQLRYIDRPHDRFDGRISVDALGLSAHLALRLDKASKHHLVLGARQSWLSAYLAAARAAGALDTEDGSADYGEIFGRYRYDDSPASRFRITLLHSRDRLLFDDVNLHHSVLGIAADWRYRYSEGGQLEATLSHSTNSTSEPPTEANYPYRRTWHDREHRTMLRALLRERIGKAGEIRFSMESAVTSLDVQGEFPDTRTVPSWAHLPHAELAVPDLTIHSGGAWPDLVVSIASDLPDLLGPLSLNLGLRASLLNRSRRPYASPRLGLRLAFPSGTSVRAAVALQHQQRLNPLIVDRDLGGPDLLPERALHASLRIEQWFPAGLLLRAEVWFKGYDQLVVWTASESTPEKNGQFDNSGRGRALGAEAFVALRRGRIDLSTGYALLRSTRTANGELERVDAPGDQRHEVDAQVALLLGKKRRLKVSAEYSFASGWPISTLARIDQGDGQSFRWDVRGINDHRMDSQHRVAVQLEGSHTLRHLRLRGTIRVSAMPAGTGFTNDCPPLPQDDGSPPDCAPLEFLPVVMPWLGLQADW